MKRFFPVGIESILRQRSRVHELTARERREILLAGLHFAGGFIEPWLDPGMSDPVLSSENEFTWGPADFCQIAQIVITSGAIDAGSTPTTTLRRGLTLGRITATGKYTQYDPTATDGSQVAIGFLNVARTMLRGDTGAAAERVGTMVIKGPVKVNQVYGLDEYARRQLQNRFIFDDLRTNIGGYPKVVAKTADYTVVNDTDNDTLFTNQGAVGAVVFTLPTTIKRGQRFRFAVEAGQTITVTAAAGKLVAYNNAAATSIAFSTSSEKIGGMVEIVANADATKYLSFVSLGFESQTIVIA